MSSSTHEYYVWPSLFFPFTIYPSTHAPSRTPDPYIHVSPSAGNITCAAYPLDYLDTINVNTGETQTKSALNLIAYGVRTCACGGRGSGKQKLQVCLTVAMAMVVISVVLSFYSVVGKNLLPRDPGRG